MQEQDSYGVGYQCITVGIEGENTLVAGSRRERARYWYAKQR